MSFRTRTQLRQMVAKLHPLPFLDLTANASGNSTSTITANVLERFQDNKMIGAHVYIDGGSPAVNSATHREFEVTDSTQSTGLLTIRPTLDAAPNNLAFEILPYAADAIHDAINISIVEAYKKGWLKRQFWAPLGVSGSPIFDPFFSAWGGGTVDLDGWVRTGTLARLQSTGTTYLLGDNAAQLRNAGSVHLHEQYERWLSDFRGHSMDVYAMLWASAGSQLRVQIMEDDAVAASSDYHAGDSKWHLLQVNRTPDSAVNRINVAVNSAGATADAAVSAIWVEGGPTIRDYPIPINLMPDGPDEIFWDTMDRDDSNLTMQVSPYNPKPVEFKFVRYSPEASASNVGIVRFGRQAPPPGMRLWARGSGPLSQPTADTDVVELDEVDALLLSKMAALHLAQADSFRGTPSFEASMENFKGELEFDIAELSRRPTGDDSATALHMRW